jgi:predicted transcriptional regulator
MVAYVESSMSGQEPLDLRAIAERLQRGDTPERISIRDLLLLTLGAYRRGPLVVEQLRRMLADAGLKTNPDFEIPYIDYEVEFVRADNGTPPREVSPSARELDEDGTTPGVMVSRDALAASLTEPTYRVHRLRTANSSPEWVTPQTTLAEAATIMLARDCSQLPVGNSLRHIKGVVSWKSIGSRLVLGEQPQTVDQAMDRAAIVDATESIFAALPLIAENQYVLVKAADGMITGIITSTDLTLQFRELTEPFLLIQETELFLRNIIGRKFDVEELQSARFPGDEARTVASVNDLTLGEMQRFLENERNFERTGMRINRKRFNDDLKKVCSVRNDVMHFDTDALGEAQLRVLRDFVRFLQKLDRIRGIPASK